MRTHISDMIQGKKKKLYGSSVGERKQRRRLQRAQTTSKAISGTESKVFHKAPSDTTKFSLDSHFQENNLNQRNHFDNEIEDSDDEILLHPWSERMKTSMTRDHFESSNSYKSVQGDYLHSQSIPNDSFDIGNKTENREKMKGKHQSMELWQRRRTRGGTAEDADGISPESQQNVKVMKIRENRALNMSDASSISDNIVWTQVSRKKALRGTDYDDSESFDPNDECDDAKPPKIRKPNSPKSFNKGKNCLKKKSRREDENKIKVELARDSLDFYTQADENIPSQSEFDRSSLCTSSESSGYQTSQETAFMLKKRKAHSQRSAIEKLARISKDQRSRKGNDSEKKEDILIKNQTPDEYIGEKASIDIHIDSYDISRHKSAFRDAFDGKKEDCNPIKSRPNNVETEIDAAFQSFRKASSLFTSTTIENGIDDVQRAVETLTVSYLELNHFSIQDDSPGSTHRMDKDIAKVSRDNLKHCFKIMEHYCGEMLQLLFTILYHHFQVVSFSQLYDFRAKGLVSPSVSIFLSDHVIICKLIDALIKVTTSDDEQVCNCLVRDGVSVVVLFSLHMMKKETILEIADASVLSNQSLLEGIRNLIDSIPDMYTYSLMEASLLFIAKIRYNVLLSLSHVSRQSIRKQRIEFAKRLSTTESGGSLDLIEHTDPNLPKHLQSDLYDGACVKSHKSFEEWSRSVITSKSSTVTSFRCNGIYSPFDGNLGAAIARSAMIHVNAKSLSFFVHTKTVSSEKVSESDIFPRNRALVNIPFSSGQDEIDGVINKKECALTLNVDRSKADGLDLILPEKDTEDRNLICIKIYIRHSEYFLFERHLLQLHGKLVHENCTEDSSLSDGASILTRYSKKSLITSKFDGRPETLKKMHEHQNNHATLFSVKKGAISKNMQRPNKEVSAMFSQMSEAVDCNKGKTVFTPSRTKTNDDSFIEQNTNHLNETQDRNQRSILEVTPLPLIDHDLKKRRLRFASNRSPIDTLVSLCRILSFEGTAGYKQLKDALENPNMIDIAECIIGVDEKLLRATTEIEAVAHDLKHIANLASEFPNESFTKGLDLFNSMKDAFDDFKSYLDDKKTAIEHDFASLMWQKLSSCD